MYPKRLILGEAKQMGVAIAPIDINLSSASYLVEDNGGAIRIALSDVSGISTEEVSTIISGQPYIDLADFVYRSGAARPTTEALIMVGGFDQLHKLETGETSGINRRDLLLHLQDLYRLNGAKNSINQSQMNLGFEPPPLEASGLPNLTSSEIVKNEVDILGMDISSHLMEFYGDFLNAIGAVRSSDLLKYRSGSSVLVAGVKVALQTPPIRSGKRVMFLTLDDGFGCNDLTFFESVQGDYAEVLRNSWLFLARGEIRRTGPRGISLRATGAWELAESYEKWRNLTVYGAAASE
jgi:error-prone DNA polymerase